MKDTEWLALFKGSPKNARTALVEEYQDLVYSIAVSRLRGCTLDDIEDCVNEIFAEIFDSIPSFSPKNGTLKAFVSTIAVRVSINTFKKNMRRISATSSFDGEEMHIPDPVSDAENSVHEAEFRKRLWEIVDSLGEVDSRIIVYQYCYDLKVKDIAKLLSMSAEAVQKRSLRARKRIRKILEKEELL